MRTQQSGHAAEDRACRYLQKQGLRLIERNYRCRQGEIDLVMEDRGQLVFVEVRLRTSPVFGGAAASITPAKQARLVHAGQHYLQHKAPRRSARFDVIAMDGPDDIHWIRNAFEAG